MRVGSVHLCAAVSSLGRKSNGAAGRKATSPGEILGNYIWGGQSTLCYAEEYDDYKKL